MQFLIEIVFAFSLMGTAFAQSCSEENRTNNLETCLTEIRTRAQDNQLYWFGSGYNERCPDGPTPTDPNCALLAGITIPQSIGSLIFPDGDFDPSQLDRYLNVKYTSNPGNYSGCGNEYVFKDTLKFTVDPVSMATVNCWDVRDLPEVTWRSEISQFYSLVVLDVGHKVLHAIYVNIFGNDIPNADVINAYAGPGNPFRFGNVYVFLLFRQTGRVEPVDRFTPALGKFNLTELKILQHLTGPIAMNWILAAGDPYSVGKQRERGLVDNCPSFVTDAIVDPVRPFIPENPKFDVGVYVTYRSPQFRFTSCCTQYLIPATNITLNPLGHGLVKPGEARVAPHIQLTRTTVFFNPETGFNDKVYTLIMVDPDITAPQFGTNRKLFIHWLVTNIRNGDVTTGDRALPYLAPTPLNDKHHYYYFLVYEQNGSIESTAIADFTDDNCSGIHTNRCLFDINNFVSVNNLKLAGATWMVSRKDEYVSYFIQTAGVQESRHVRG